jgi:hypothetical protein
MTLLNFDTHIMKIYFNFFHIAVYFNFKKGQTKVWLKNYTWLHYVVEPSWLYFNLPITPHARIFIKETSCKLFVNT